MVELGGMKIKKIHATRFVISVVCEGLLLTWMYSRGWASITEVVPA
jgi:hypothetical protein